MPSVSSRCRAAMLAAGIAGLAACQPAQTRPEPTVTALIVRNTSVFDVKIFAMRGDDAKPLWLGTVAPSATYTFPVSARSLGPNATLVLRTQAAGASSTWTSNAIAVGAETIAVLDLATTSTGNCAGSQLRAIAMSDIVGTRP